MINELIGLNCVLNRICGLHKLLELGVAKNSERNIRTYPVYKSETDEMK